MKAAALFVSLLASAGCTAPSTPSQSASVGAATELDCGEIVLTVCESVAEAGEALTGTDALAVESLALPDDARMTMTERYLVRLASSDGAGEELAEVVKFTGSDDWSVRRLEDEPED